MKGQKKEEEDEAKEESCGERQKQDGLGPLLCAENLKTKTL